MIMICSQSSKRHSRKLNCLYFSIPTYTPRKGTYLKSTNKEKFLVFPYLKNQSTVSFPKTTVGLPKNCLDSSKMITCVRSYVFAPNRKATLFQQRKRLLRLAHLRTAVLLQAFPALLLTKTHLHSWFFVFLIRTFVYSFS